MTVIAAERSECAPPEQTADNDEPPSDPQKPLTNPSFYLIRECNRLPEIQGGPVHASRLLCAPSSLSISKT